MEKNILSDFDKKMIERIMLVLDDYIGRNKEVNNYSKLSKKIGISKQKLSNVRSFRTKLSNEHLYRLSTVIGMNINFAYGVSREMYNKSHAQPLSEQLQDVATQLKNLNL